MRMLEIVRIYLASWGVTCDLCHIASVAKVDIKITYLFACSSCATGIGLTLNSVQYTNNSVVTITDIGTGSAALNCTTTYAPCCYSGPPPGTHWYFPNGSRAENNNVLPYYRTRTAGRYLYDHSTRTSTLILGAVLLHRNPEGTTTGVYRCDIRDENGAFQSIYVGVYTAITGESCTLKRKP